MKQLTFDVRRELSRARRSGAAGVTLVEVLVVVAIMAMLATGVGLYVLPKFKDAQIATAKQNALNLRKAVQSWHLTNNEGCPTVSELIESKEIDTASNTDDPWGQEYEITCVDGETMVASNGPDTKKGTADDIVVPQARRARADD